MIDTIQTVAQTTQPQKEDSKHVAHQKLMLEHLRIKEFRINCHKAKITTFLTPRKLQSDRG